MLIVLDMFENEPACPQYKPQHRPLWNNEMRPDVKVMRSPRLWLSPSRLLCSQSHFVSALTVVFVNSKSLSSIKIDDTPVDDPSLKVLVANNSDTLKLLKMSSCPHVSPAGQCITVWVTPDLIWTYELGFKSTRNPNRPRLHSWTYCAWVYSSTSFICNWI